MLIKESEEALSRMREDEIFGLMFETGVDSEGFPLDLQFYSRGRDLQDQLERMKLARRKMQVNAYMEPLSGIVRFILLWVLGFRGHYAVIWGLLRIVLYGFCFAYFGRVFGIMAVVIMTLGTTILQLRRERDEKEYGRDIFKRGKR